MVRLSVIIKKALKDKAMYVDWNGKAIGFPSSLAAFKI